MINRNKLYKEFYEKSLLLNVIYEKIKMTLQDFKRLDFDEADEVVIQFNRQEMLNEEERFKEVMQEVYNICDQLQTFAKWNINNTNGGERAIDRPRECVNKCRKKRARKDE